MAGSPFLLALVRTGGREEEGHAHLAIWEQHTSVGHGGPAYRPAYLPASFPASSPGKQGKWLSRGAGRGWAGPGLGKVFPSQPGRLKKVQGIGWYLDEKNLAQVSTNLLDFEVTALHTVYEETCREARVSRVVPPDPPGCPQAQPGG